MPTTQLEHKVIVITGGAGYFGSSAVKRFLGLGANVAALDVSEDALASLDGEGFEGQLLKIVCNVTNADGVTAAVNQIVEKFGPPDYLWNNAGYQGAICPTLEYSITDFSRVMNINVTGMFIVLQACAKLMPSGSSIVNTASVAGIKCTPAMVAYSASKAAVIAMTSCTAKDLAPKGIRVNAVSPALIGPGMMWDRQNELHAACDSPYFANDAEKVAKNKVNGVPMKRLGSVEEVVDMVEFLFSDKASYVTGTNMVVDGGMSSGLR
ncbi:hypothetical protein TrLO_g473 [Triparma laevis f. longispina]|uniref:Uncharacterized protein n=2 Tax=Triparma laevis TaxID=1534972 RepID=A0A9W7C7D3_9STRA|nr:hypothetical protein TrLO_g473 [Triparma laevis f. longispina]